MLDANPRARSKSKLESELNRASWQDSVSKKLFSKRFPSQTPKIKLVNRNSEVRVVEQVEELSSELSSSTFVESEMFVNGQVYVYYARGAKMISASHADVFQPRIDPFVEGSVKIIVTAKEHRVRLACLEGAYAGKLPASEDFAILK